MQKGPIERQPAGVRATKGSFALLARFWRDWLAPYRSQILVSLALMAFVAATTGAYSEIVKLAFNALGTAKPAPGALSFVIAAIAGMTFLRAVFLYLQTVATNRTVNRIGLDMQKAGYATDPNYATKLSRAIRMVAQHGTGMSPSTGSIQVVAAPADSAANGGTRANKA